MDFDHILVERSGEYATIPMHRPQRRNALSLEHMRELITAFGDVARQIAAGAAVSTEMVKSYVAAFATAGCDELIFVPTTAAPDQIRLLASAAL